MSVLNRDPLQDIRNSIDIRYVMKGGRLYESATLNEVSRSRSWRQPC